MNSYRKIIFPNGKQNSYKKAYLEFPTGIKEFPVGV